MVILKMLAYAALTLSLPQACSQGDTCTAGLQVPEDQARFLQAQVHVNDMLDESTQTHSRRRHHHRHHHRHRHRHHKEPNFRDLPMSDPRFEASLDAELARQEQFLKNRPAHNQHSEGSINDADVSKAVQDFPELGLFVPYINAPDIGDIQYEAAKAKEAAEREPRRYAIKPGGASYQAAKDVADAVNKKIKEVMPNVGETLCSMAYRGRSCVGEMHPSSFDRQLTGITVDWNFRPNLIQKDNKSAVAQLEKKVKTKKMIGKVFAKVATLASGARGAAKGAVVYTAKKVQQGYMLCEKGVGTALAQRLCTWTTTKVVVGTALFVSGMVVTGGLANVAISAAAVAWSVGTAIYDFKLKTDCIRQCKLANTIAENERDVRRRQFARQRECDKVAMSCEGCVWGHTDRDRHFHGSRGERLKSCHHPNEKEYGRAFACNKLSMIRVGMVNGVAVVMGLPFEAALELGVIGLEGLGVVKKGAGAVIRGALEKAKDATGINLLHYVREFNSETGNMEWQTANTNAINGVVGAIDTIDSFVGLAAGNKYRDLKTYITGTNEECQPVEMIEVMESSGEKPSAEKQWEEDLLREASKLMQTSDDNELRKWNLARAAFEAKQLKMGALADLTPEAQLVVEKKKYEKRVGLRRYKPFEDED